MSETNETLTDIVAEKRRLADEMEKSLGDQHSYVESLRFNADRIEAAWRREKAMLEADALAVGGIVEAKRKGELSKMRPKNAADFGRFGNAAVMREAVISIIASVKDESEDTELPCVAYGIARRVRRMAEAALSAPARNCDLPLVVDGPANNNADKAWLVFKQAHPEAYFDVPGLLRCIEWLLAPATKLQAPSSKL